MLHMAIKLIITVIIMQMLVTLLIQGTVFQILTCLLQFSNLYFFFFRFGRIRSIVTTKDLQAGQELFCKYAGTVDSTTFVRQIFKDFSNFMDLDDDGSRLTYLNEMRNDYQSMMSSLNHDPDKVYRKPDLVQRGISRLVIILQKD